MEKNIAEIISLQIPKNIIQIWGYCENDEIIIRHCTKKYLCRGCKSIVCHYCISKNKTKCGVCISKKYDYCDLCGEKIKILPCYKCDNVIKKCRGACENYRTSYGFKDDGFCCSEKCYQ